jgi:hypothetical protein
MFLGKYTFDLLCEVQLPCGHPGLKESLCLLIDGKQLPCGHPTLDEILLKALEKDECCNEELLEELRKERDRLLKELNIK